MRKLAVAAILGLVLVLLLSSAIPTRATHGDTSGLYGGNLRVAVRAAISLNPFTATSADSWKVIPLVYDSLARIAREISREFTHISAESLQTKLPEITADSSET